MPSGRPSALNQDDTREQLALLIARGLSAPEIGEIMGRHEQTIKVWRQDEEVQARVTTLRRERVNRFVSKIDQELEKRLENPGKLTVTELVKIRQTLMPKASESSKPDPEAARARWREQDEQTATERVPIPSG